MSLPITTKAKQRINHGRERKWVKVQFISTTKWVNDMLNGRERGREGERSGHWLANSFSHKLTYLESIRSSSSSRAAGRRTALRRRW